MTTKALSRVSMMVKAAQLYFEADMNQNDISQQLGISRSYVSKLLLEAKEQGIVNVSIRDPLMMESELERIIRQHFNLRKVLVAESRVEDNAANDVAKKAADFLNSIVKDGDIIATGWGRTIYLVARHLPHRNDLKGIRTVSLYGQQTVMKQNVFVTEALTLMTQAFNAVSYLLAVPVFLSSAKMVRLCLKEESVVKAFSLIQRANIAIFTIGSPKRSSFLDQPNGLSDEEVRALVANGAIADVCLHVINRDGQLSNPEMDERMIAVSLEDLKHKDYRIAVASGRYKMDAVYTALEQGYINVLAVDEDIAKDIVERINHDGE